MVMVFVSSDQNEYRENKESIYLSIYHCEMKEGNACRLIFVCCGLSNLFVRVCPTYVDVLTSLTSKKIPTIILQLLLIHNENALLLSSPTQDTRPYSSYHIR